MCKKCVAFPKNVHTNATSSQKCDETFLQKCATWFLHNFWSFLTKKNVYFREFAEAYSARNAFIAFYWLDECLSKLRSLNWNLLNDCFCLRKTLDLFCSNFLTNLRTDKKSWRINHRTRIKKSLNCKIPKCVKKSPTEQKYKKDNITFRCCLLRIFTS